MNGRRRVFVELAFRKRWARQRERDRQKQEHHSRVFRRGAKVGSRPGRFTHGLLKASRMSLWEGGIAARARAG